MLQNSLKWGAIGGGGAIILCIIIFIIAPFKLTESLGMLIYLPLLFCMIYGGITYRQENGNQLTFGKAFMTIWIIAITGSMLLNVFNSAVLFRIISPNYQQTVMDRKLGEAREKMESQNLTDEQIDKNLEFAKKLPYEFIGYVMSVIYGIILSLLIAIFVKRNPEAINTGGTV